MEGARQEGEETGLAKGRQEGLAQGSLAGKVQLLQQLLGEIPGSTENLVEHPTDQLAGMVTELQERLRSRDGYGPSASD